MSPPAKKTHEKTRCHWPKTELSIEYHDLEWGAPIHDERRLFEHLILGGAQAGLSWETVLRKRDSYRRAFDQFDPERIARYNDRKIASLLADPGIIRNRQKVASAVKNARALLTLRDDVGSFDKYLWSFVDNRPIQNAWSTLKDLPARTELSDALSKDLKRRGFSFVGSTICYAVMQAVGMVNDHQVTCFRHRELGGKP